jgi:hypothetical protein
MNLRPQGAAQEDSAQGKFDVAVQGALAYYEGLKRGWAASPAPARAARSFRVRVFAMMRQWINAIRELSEVQDSAALLTEEDNNLNLESIH